MRSSIFYSAAFAAAASAQSVGPSSSIDAYPQTTLLQFTNSLGVVTGQPAVVTQQPSQPAAATVIPVQPPVVTSQPLPANIPAVGPGVHTLVLPGTGSAFNSTRTVVVSANNSTTVQLQTSTPAAASASGAASGTPLTNSLGQTTGTSRPSGSAASGTGAPQNSQAAAANLKVAGGALGLGAFVAAFL